MTLTFIVTETEEHVRQLNSKNLAAPRTLIRTKLCGLMSAREVYYVMCTVKGKVLRFNAK
jgi:hypothetical protein